MILALFALAVPLKLVLKHPSEIKAIHYIYIHGRCLDFAGWAWRLGLLPGCAMLFTNGINPSAVPLPYIAPSFPGQIMWFGRIQNLPSIQPTFPC
jgi:hypothetical protein